MSLGYESLIVRRCGLIKVDSDTPSFFAMFFKSVDTSFGTFVIVTFFAIVLYLNAPI